MTSEQRAEYQRDYRKKNRERIHAINRRYVLKNRDRYLAWNLKSSRKKLGVSPTRAEPSACEICGRPPERVLCLDHNHDTKLFRGWLCKRCNTGLGSFQDSLLVLEAAVRYMKEHNR